MSALNPGMNWRRNSLRRLTNSTAELADSGQSSKPRKSALDGLTSSLSTPLEELPEDDEDDGSEEYDGPAVITDAQKKAAKNHCQLARMQQEAHACLHHLHNQAKGENEILQHFLDFVLHDEARWKDMWSRFRPDGTMSFEQFEKFAHWDWKWSGELIEVFELLGGEHGTYITNTRCLELKRWWQVHKDLAEADDNVFRRRLSDHYGNMGCAWRLALDKHNMGRCCYLTFCRVCHDVGPIRGIKSLWSTLVDGDIYRPLYLRDLDPEGDMLLHQFAQSLVLHGGTLLKGWHQIIENGGGHLHRDSFIEQCAGFGIGEGPAKWIFSVLDPHGTRYVTEFDDDLDFLWRYDPGPLSLNAGDHGGHTHQIAGSGSPRQPFYLVGDRKGPKEFVLEVELTPEEHEEYLNKMRTHQMVGGIDMAGEKAREQKRREEEARNRKPKAAPKSQCGITLAVGWTSMSAK